MAACKAIASLFGSRSSLFIKNTKLGFIKTIIPNESKRQFATLTSAFVSSSTLSENKFIKKIQNDRQIHVSRSRLDTRKDNYYKTLGIPKNSSSKDINKAYHQLAKIYYCDTDENDTEAKKKFQKVQQAYRALNDDNNKKKENDDAKFITEFKNYCRENGADTIIGVLLLSAGIYLLYHTFHVIIIIVKVVLIALCVAFVSWLFFG